MKRTLLITACVALCAATNVPAAGSDHGKAVFMGAGDIKWSDVPGFAGVQMAPVQGDVARGAHHMFLKYKEGFVAPVHHHSPDHFVTVTAGTLVLTVDGKEHRLPPGSYFSFQGRTPHATRCEAGADCVIFLDVRGKWDVVPEKAKP